MSHRTLSLTDELHAYLLAQGVRESDAARRLREETAGMPMARMQISPEQGALMQMLVRLLGARRTLEIGTFTGYSALVVAEALPAGARVVTCDVSAEWTAIARRYWAEAGVADRIDLRLRPALETLDDLLAGGSGSAFDFSFIDADKTNYDAYYERSLALLRPGGLVAIDNTLWSGAVIDAARNDEDTRAIRALNARVRQDQRVEMVMLPVGDGLTLARKKQGR
jgi:caffeoyl-CoA O-methyltransferase